MDTQSRGNINLLTWFRDTSYEKGEGSRKNQRETCLSGALRLLTSRKLKVISLLICSLLFSSRVINRRGRI